MPTTFNVRNTDKIRSDDPYLAEALQDIIQQVSVLQQQVQTLQSQVEALRNASA